MGRKIKNDCCAIKSKKIIKKYKKRLDKPQTMWYNRNGTQKKNRIKNIKKKDKSD